MKIFLLQRDFCRLLDKFKETVSVEQESPAREEGQCANEDTSLQIDAKLVKVAGAIGL